MPDALRRIVVDTNVLVSGLLRRGSPPGLVVDLLADGALDLVVTDAIVAEYQDVLSRPRLGLDPADVQRFLADTALVAEYVTPEPLDVELPDPDDVVCLEAAVAGEAGAVVTGNTRHFAPVRGTHAVRILSPREFIECF